MSKRHSAAPSGRPIIAIDADGVMLDYNAAFAAVFKLAFGRDLELADPRAFHATRGGFPPCPLRRRPPSTQPPTSAASGAPCLRFQARSKRFKLSTTWAMASSASPACPPSMARTAWPILRPWASRSSA